MKIEEMLSLARYNRWANGRVYRRAANLPPEELRTLCWLSQGNVFKTLIHIVDTQWYWLTGCRTGILPVETISEEQFSGIDPLRAFSQEQDEQLIAYVEALSEEKLVESIEYRWARAKPRRKQRWQILMHILSHGIHHRSELGQYLASIGRPVGNMDFIIFVSKEDR